MSVQRLLRPVSLAFVMLMMFASSSRACLNDTGIKPAEEEFRSQYDALAPSDPPASSSFNPWGVAALAIGSGLAGGFLRAGIQRKRRAGR